MYVAAVILTVLAILLFMPIGVRVYYYETLLLEIRLFCFHIPLKNIGAKSEKKAKPVAEEKPSEAVFAEGTEKWREALDFALELLGDFRRFVRRRIKVTDASFEMALGTSDAAQTAILTGVAYAAVYNLFSLLDRFITVYKPEVSITPHFNQDVLKVRAGGIILTRLAHIIAIGAVFGIKYLSYKRRNRQ
ncbi:MAG: DUF2953 domain-containing protein [Clostridia bacterium]|nr:DUF2953 domain-containing protein [Clostridia bacterium]